MSLARKTLTRSAPVVRASHNDTKPASLGGKAVDTAPVGGGARVGNRGGNRGRAVLARSVDVLEVGCGTFGGKSFQEWIDLLKVQFKKVKPGRGRLVDEPYINEVIRLVSGFWQIKKRDQDSWSDAEYKSNQEKIDKVHVLGIMVLLENKIWGGVETSKSLLVGIEGYCARMAAMALFIDIDSREDDPKISIHCLNFRDQINELLKRNKKKIKAGELSEWEFVLLGFTAFTLKKRELMEELSLQAGKYGDDTKRLFSDAASLLPKQ